jgi:hypothetical protein
MFLIVERAIISVSRYQSLYRSTLSKLAIGLSKQLIHEAFKETMLDIENRAEIPVHR